MIDTLKPNSSNSEKPSLIIYSYSSFTSKWGPGPIIKKKFEEICHCKIQLREADDARLLVQRLVMEGGRSKADVIIGVNQWDLNEAYEKLKFSKEYWPQELNFSDPHTLEKLGEPGELIPFDWGIFAFNTKASSPLAKVKNWDEFLNQLPNKGLVLQDPRTSAPGLSFINWLVEVFGEDKAFLYLDKMKDKIYTITSGWSSSYGLFQKGQAQSVFSYVTSPLYHLVEENDRNYRAINFKEGLPIHVEFSGVLKSCQNCTIAKKFIQFMLTSNIQTILMKKNYMFPVDKNVVKNTPWDIETKFKVLPFKKMTKSTQESILKRWELWSRNR